MSGWDEYRSRIESIGGSQRGAALKREKHFLTTKLRHSLSYKAVELDGVCQNVAVVNTDNLEEKFVYSLPGEDIKHGCLIFWQDNYWLVTERDADDELYTRAKMVQCNYLLKWIDRSSVIHEQWCIVEDGTKYLVGTYEDRDFIVSRGDSRLGLTIAKNAATTKLERGTRFLIDDPESDTPLAYELTKPFKLGKTYNGQGVFKFVMQEVNTTDDDNQDLMVADYYKHFPREDTGETSVSQTIDPENTFTEDGKKVWL